MRARAVDLVVLDVNETLSDLSPLQDRFAEVGAPGHLLGTWFAGTLRDGFALAVTGRSEPFRRVADAVLRTLLHDVPLTCGTGEAVSHVLDGLAGLDVHPDVPAGLRLLADGGMRVVTLTNGSTAVSRALLERAGLTELVERQLSVDDAGRWKPHPDAYGYAAQQCGVPLERCAMVAVHPWDLTGARTVGMTTCWIDRSGAPWPDVQPRPDLTGVGLDAVAAAVLTR